MANFDDLQGAVAQFGAGNKVIFDDTGMPSIMVGVSKMKYSDLITGGTDEVLPFFIVDGEEKNTIYASKFLNIVENERAYSLAMKLPKNYITFDQSVAACKKKGNGWHLNQTGIFGLLATLSYKMGTAPHGNNNHGKDYYHPYEHGIQPQGEAERTLTGSGAPTWYHNHDMSGIADLNGNVWEWTGGVRINNGEIQIIPYGNCMKLDCDMSAASTLWKAIKPDGTLVEPGTAGTLKVNRMKISTTAGTAVADGTFKSITADTDISIPKLLIALGMFPDSGITYGNDRYYNNPDGESLPIRGSGFRHTSYSGVSALYLTHARSYSAENIGFRSAFCEL